MLDAPAALAAAAAAAATAAADDPAAEADGPPAAAAMLAAAAAAEEGINPGGRPRALAELRAAAAESKSFARGWEDILKSMFKVILTLLAYLRTTPDSVLLSPRLHQPRLEVQTRPPLLRTPLAADSRP
jgi:hypothetical protein